MHPTSRPRPTPLTIPALFPLLLNSILTLSIIPYYLLILGLIPFPHINMGSRLFAGELVVDSSLGMLQSSELVKES